MNPYLALALVILGILGLRFIWVYFWAWRDGRLPEMKAKYHAMVQDMYWRHQGK